jgi:transcription elongation GreA/GreB family factor
MRLPTRKKERERMENEDVDVYVTERKLTSMKKTLETLLAHDRPDAIAEVRRTGEMGDFSENAGYQIAKATLRRINTRIDILQDRIARAIVIQRRGTSDVVQIGSIVTVQSDGRTWSFQILGSQESNPAQGKISRHSPIGKALLGAHVHDVVNVNLGARSVSYTILTIS